jgi:hypothetical protein
MNSLLRRKDDTEVVNVATARRRRCPWSTGVELKRCRGSVYKLDLDAWVSAGVSAGVVGAFTIVQRFDRRRNWRRR